MFYDKFRTLCAERGVYESNVAQAIGLSRASATGWKKGAEPSPATMQRIAEYFGVPVTYFLEDEKKHVTPNDDIVRFALFGGRAVTDDQYNAILLFRDFILWQNGDLQK